MPMWERIREERIKAMPCSSDNPVTDSKHELAGELSFNFLRFFSSVVESTLLNALANELILKYTNVSLWEKLLIV